MAEVREPSSSDSREPSDVLPAAPYEARASPALFPLSLWRVATLPVRVASTALVFSLISVLARVYLLIRSPVVDRWFCRFAGWSSWFLLRVVFGFRLCVQGGGGGGVQGDVVLVANHVAVYDGFALMAGSRGAVSFVARESFFRVPVIGAVLKALGVVGIDRRRPQAARDALRRALRKGGSTKDEESRKDRRKPWPVAVFPEGTTTNGVGLLPFKTGAFVGDVVRPVALRYACASGFDLSYTSNQLNIKGVLRHYLRTLLEPEKTIYVRLLPPVTRRTDESDQAFADRTRVTLAENYLPPPLLEETKEDFQQEEDDDDLPLLSKKFHLWEGWDSADLRKAWFDERTSAKMD
mmetsp:Transcript_30490/g.98276  ORF Transcript_30490/g.98276 Transcript_30490/m.98276 type:complete len:351 (-) Transcript_30490:224-1276(-)